MIERQASIANSQSVVIGLNAVIVTVTDDMPRVLTVARTHDGNAAGDALPFGTFDPAIDRTLETGLRRWIREQTGLEVGYVEQLYTFGDRNRDPLESRGGPRVLSVAYLALVCEGRPGAASASAHWEDSYSYFPWEDWRRGRPAIIEKSIAPALRNWVRVSPETAIRRERRERADINFGLWGAPWAGERVLERYELLYAAGLVPEAIRDRRLPLKGTQNRGKLQPLPGASQMALDHRRILATALGRIRGKLKYRPVVFELLPSTFTLLQLQRLVESLAGVRLHKQNLRRLVEKGRLVEGTGQFDVRTGGRPAELFRFRREVLRERPAPGVGLPGLPRLESSL